jgi:hypothetical protein
METKEVIFKIVCSEIRLIVVTISLSISLVFDLFLIQLLIKNWDQGLYLLLLLIIPLSLILAFAFLRVSRLIIILINRKSILEYNGNTLTESLDHNIKIAVTDIKRIEIKKQVGAFRPPFEISIKTQNNKDGLPYRSNSFSIISLRSKNNLLLIDSMFIKGKRKLIIKELCDEMKLANPRIKVIQLGVWD